MYFTVLQYLMHTRAMRHTKPLKMSTLIILQNILMRAWARAKRFTTKRIPNENDVHGI